MTLPSIELFGMTVSPDTTVSVIIFGYGLLATSLVGLWHLSARHAKFVLEHEALKSQSAKNEAQIMNVDEASKTRDASVRLALDEVKAMMKLENQQMIRMSSKIDLLISVLVNRTDATVDLAQIMAILEKGDRS